MPRPYLHRSATPQVGLVHQASAEFTELLAGEQFDEAMLRMTYRWCGAISNMTSRDLSSGIGLLYRSCLEAFLESHKYTIHGITGTDDNGQSPPQFESIEINGQSRRFPKDAIYFVENSKTQARFVIGFKDGSPMRDCEMALNGPGTDGMLQDFEQFVKSNNHLRGQQFGLDGSILRGIDPIRLNDVILTEDQLQIIKRHVLGFARRMDDIEAMGGRLQRGVLLEGVPGTGKSHLVKALLNEIENFSVCLATPSDFASSDGVDHLRTLVEYTAPVLVIVEEVDIIGEHRESNFGSASSMATWMQILDGLLSIKGVLTIATTNRPEMVEQALAMRPGRFDRRIKFGPLPDEERSRLIDLLARPLQLEAEAKSHLLEHTGDLTGAQIKEILQTARLIMLDQTGKNQQAYSRQLIDFGIIDQAIADCGYREFKHTGFAGLAT